MQKINIRSLIAHVVSLQVASPMAGTFYRSPAPGEPPFVRKGDKVTKGQPVAIIEAMKLMNEIEVSSLMQADAPCSPDLSTH